jgi:uncharacterized SAM-binding protein YcdF (DUF218 family)
MTYATLKSLAATLLMPLPLLLGLALVGFLLWALGRRRLGPSFVLFSVAALFLLSWSPVADRLIGFYEEQYPVLDPATLDRPVEAVVVLGGGWSSAAPWPAGIRLYGSARARLMEGLRLLETLPEARLLVSGGTRRPDAVPVAVGYRLAAIDLGVDPARIVTLAASHDTADEAYEVRELLGPGARFVLVTSAVHLPRAMHHFQRVGLDPVPAPAEFRTWRGRAKRLGYWVPSPQNLAKSDAAWYEFLGRLVVRFEHAED